MSQVEIGFIGCGKMGRALLEGLLQAGVYAPDTVLVSAASSAPQTAAELGVRAASVAEVAAQAPLIIFAVKPQQAAALTPLSLRPEQRCISLIAGRSHHWLQRLSAPAPMVRAMPNLGVARRRGVTLLLDTRDTPTSVTEEAARLFGAVGHVERLSREELFHGATAISGCAPAFFFLALEAVADGAVAAGLPRSVALRLAAETLVGSGELAREEHPALLKDKVCSPGGLTIQGVQRLEQGGLRGALFDAVSAAAARSEALEAVAPQI